MTTRDYIVAGIKLRLTQPHFTFEGLAPFAAEAATQTGAPGTPDRLDTPDHISHSAHFDTPDLEVRQALQPVSAADFRQFDEFDFREANADCRLARSGSEYLFTMTPRTSGDAVFFHLDSRSGIVTTNFTPKHRPALFRFGLWICFSLIAVSRGTVAIHSSVIAHNGGAVLFLGESGTGKSTHTRLWREHIPGATLLNDDSPMLSVSDGQVTAFGSPWSGKTPCYRNEHYPVRAIVRLSQGPENRMDRLSVIRAYGALHPSVPPSFVHDEQLADGINRLLSEVLARVPVFHLACRPDAEAAELSHSTIFRA